jgi:beta-aspartyl-dipeptidase (metallo-type)
MFVLIKNGNVFTPQAVGKKDILVCAGKIVQIADQIEAPAGLPAEVIDASGMSVTPGIVDAHIHMLGAGGGDGPDTRSSLVHLSVIARAGVTTAVGTLGLDTMGYGPRELYIRARALEREGLSTYILTGSYALPSVTITGSVPTDIVFVDKVIGLKMAMREVLSKSPDEELFKQVIVEVMRAGRWSAKAGVVVAHQGDVPGSLGWVCGAMEELMIPRKHFVATHINRSPAVLNDAIDCAKRGMILDLTGNIPMPETVAASKALRLMMEAGVPMENITFSSDSGAYYNVAGKDVVLPVNVCIKELRLMVKNEGISLSDALTPLTVNPARLYGLSGAKGRLETGLDADILLLDGELNVDTVLAKGKVLVKARKPVVRGRLEEAYYEKLTMSGENYEN